MGKLREELRNVNLSHPPGYREAHDRARLPYLDAVIKEGLRIHPSVGLCIERLGKHVLPHSSVGEPPRQSR